MLLNYWDTESALRNITPQNKPWPEGEDFPELLVELVGGDTVLEFGCGTGRLAKCFVADRYIGVDISEQQLAIARQACPQHRFELAGDSLPTADVTLAHTVLLHVSDDDLSGVVSRFASPRVIVNEILGRHWRRSGLPPVFNREAEEYEAALAPRYTLTRRMDWMYPHYRDTDLSVMEFERC